MQAAIYARTSRVERGENVTAIPNQVTFCRELALRHNLVVDDRDVFTDIEMEGGLLPSCWAREGDPARPALSALIETIERGAISCILVRRLEKLGTSSEVLVALLGFLKERNVSIVVDPDQLADPDVRAAFAASILRPCLRWRTDLEEESIAKLRARKVEEIERLKARIARLEAEVADL